MPQGPPPSLQPSSIYSMPKTNDNAPTEMAPMPPIATSPNGTSPSSPSSNSPSGPAPSMPPPRPPAVLAPPPPVAPRRVPVVSPKNSTAGQLDGLNFGEVKKPHSNVFDDSFDPRAGEKKSVSEAADYSEFHASHHTYSIFHFRSIWG